MGDRRTLWLPLLLPLAGLIVALSGLLLTLPLLVPEPALRARLVSGLLLGGLLVLGSWVAAGFWIERRCLRPLQTLSRHCYDNQESAAVVANACARAQAEQAVQLDAVLQDVREGVLICDAEGRILRYNPAAHQLLGRSDGVAFGRSLYALCTQGPLETTLELLRCRQESADMSAPPSTAAQVVCATVSGGKLLHCRLSLLPAIGTLTGAFVLTFSDITAQLEHDNLQRPLLGSSLEDLRRALTNLRAAAESMARFTNMEAGQRQMFQGVISAESEILSRRLESLTQDFRALFETQWPLGDICSVDLLQRVAQHMAERQGLVVRVAQTPLWLHVDSHSVLLLLEHLLTQLQADGIAQSVEIECLPGNRQVYVDIIWQGRPLTPAQVDSWLEQPLGELIGAGTGQAVLRRHNSDLWSQPHRQPGKSLLRLPLPASQQSPRNGRERGPARAEVNAVKPAQAAAALGTLAERSLSSLCYVVFKTAAPASVPGTAGLRLAGVRVVQGRVLTDDTFERQLQDADAPLIQQTLAQFKSFIGTDDTVLVAHNAALDMQFLHRQEAAAGVQFNHPVLDTLLLSGFLQHSGEHTLEAIADRLGIEDHGRHSALGDALITAEIFVKLLNLLEAHGMKTLRQAFEASEKLVGLCGLEKQL